MLIWRWGITNCESDTDKTNTLKVARHETTQLINDKHTLHTTSLPITAFEQIQLNPLKRCGTLHTPPETQITELSSVCSEFHPWRQHPV